MTPPDKSLQSSRQIWPSLLLFPFKVYVIIIPVWGVLQMHEPFVVREAQSRTNHYILAAYAGCVLIFVFAAIMQFVTHRRRLAVRNALFAAATFLALAFLLPMFALAK
jgi:hypothetical protein